MDRQGQASKGRTFVQRMYPPRIVGLGLGFFCVASVFYQQPTPWFVWLLLIFNGFLWPHVAYLTAKGTPHPYQAEKRNLLIDSFFGGFWVPLMSFNALPSAMVLCMMGMDNIAAGGLGFFARGAAMQLAGAALAACFTGLHFHIESNTIHVLACLPMLAIFPLSIGMITYRLAARLSQQRQSTETVNQELKDTNERLTKAYELMRAQRDQLLKHRGTEEIAIVVDQSGTILEATEQVSMCTGKPRNELIGSNLSALLDESCREDFRRELKNAWVGMVRDFSVSLILPQNGRERFEVKMTRITSNSRRALLVILR
ncbi:MAG: diguanylate cyclase AdrA [Deltaproteobacteria bacterium]|nr:diguanylate cyclase AdrA [Deltaproteobacteria bacterium]